MQQIWQGLNGRDHAEQPCGAHESLVLAVPGVARRHTERGLLSRAHVSSVKRLSSIRSHADVDLTGGYAAGLWVFAATFVVGTLVLLELGARWSAQWTPTAMRQTGIYSYRAALRQLADEA